MCLKCKALLQVSDPIDGVCGLIKNVDRGYLKYPTPPLIGICKLTCDFVNKVMKSVEVRRFGKLCTLLQSALYCRTSSGVLL